MSRPSSRAWTRTLGTPCARGQLDERDEVAVVGVDAARPDEADEVEDARRSRAPGDRRRGAPAASKNEPSAIAASIRGRSWRTGRPAPRFRWPTSELPIWPAGRPTASSDARRTACGQRARSPRQVGIGAAAIASAAGSRPIPNPSRTTRTIGRGRGRGAGHAAAPRAAAVRPARATMPAISSGLSEAPPTSAPSIDGSARNSAMLAEVTLPPYRIGRSSAGVRPAQPRQRRADRVGHRGRVPAARVPAGPDRPDRLVGDDQAGRRERRRVVAGEGAAQLALDDGRPGARPRARPAARRRTGSGAGRRRRARPSFRPMSSSVSPASRRRSEWPTMTQVARPASIGAEISPV